VKVYQVETGKGKFEPVDDKELFIFDETYTGKKNAVITGMLNNGLAKSVGDKWCKMRINAQAEDGDALFSDKQHEKFLIPHFSLHDVKTVLDADTNIKTYLETWCDDDDHIISNMVDYTEIYMNVFLLNSELRSSHAKNNEKEEFPMDPPGAS